MLVADYLDELGSVLHRVLSALEEGSQHRWLPLEAQSSDGDNGSALKVWAL